MTDAIDEFWLPIQDSYQQKKLKSITRGSAELSKVKSDKKDDDADKADKKTAAEKEAARDETEKLVTALKDILKDEVKDVALSERLVDSPVCLVAAENEVDMNLQRMLQKSQGYEKKHQRVLEINETHPVITRLRTIAAEDASSALLRETALLLLDQARIVEGEPLENPAAFVRRMNMAIEKGLVSS